MPVIFIGDRQFGRVEKVRGLCFVATDFFHRQFIPLFPLRSYFVFCETNETFPMPLHGKSVLFTYLRLFCLLGAIASFGAALFLWADMVVVYGPDPLPGVPRPFHFAPRAGWPVVIFFAASAILLPVAMILTYVLAYAGQERALSIAAKAGVDPQRISKHFARKK
jgi:hypothetical protein